MAGHVRAGESAEDAAVREALEELGLRVAPLSLLGTLRFQAVLHGGAYVENEFHDVFLARLEVDLAALTLDADEVAEVALVRPGELGRYALVPHPESYALVRAVLG